MAAVRRSSPSPQANTDNTAYNTNNNRFQSPLMANLSSLYL